MTVEMSPQYSGPLERVEIERGITSSPASLRNLDTVFSPTRVSPAFLAFLPHSRRLSTQVMSDVSRGHKSLEVRLNNGEKRQLTANTIFLNVGDSPAKPSMSGVERVPTLDSTSIMELDIVPEHLLVVGGGYVGLEFGQMFRRFGSQVSIIQRGAHLLAREDNDVADAVTDILREDGIDVLLETQTVSVEQASDSTLHLTVNDRLETDVPGIYALGDDKGGPAFTHISYDDFRIICTILLEGGNASIKDRLVPYTVFIDPQLGRVGLGETEARQQDRAIKVAKLPMDYVARALEVDETRGFIKAVVDADTQQILGCAVLGIEGGEIMATLEVAMLVSWR